MEPDKRSAFESNMTVLQRILFLTSRTYIRYAPWTVGKWAIWSHILESRFNQQALLLHAKTKFGLRHAIAFPDLIQKFIFYFGVWEPAISRYIATNLSRGDVFIDVGANIGYFTCLAAKKVGPTGTVYAIEASPSIFKTLQENIDRNHLSNVVAINKAAHDHHGTITIHNAGAENLGASTVVSELRDRPALHAEAEVEADTLKSIVGGPKLFSARVVKIDVEGAEWFVLRDLLGNLGQFSDRTDWLIEFNTEAIRQHGGSIQTIVDTFREHGYFVYQIENRYSAGWYMSVGSAPRYHDFLHPLPADLNQVRDVLFTKTRLPMIPE